MSLEIKQIEHYLRSFVEEIEKDEGIDTVVLPTDNEDHGFYGELKAKGIDEDLLSTYWNIASEHLQNNCDMSAELTRDFLDSKAGRYLVDDLDNNGLLDNNFERAIKQFLTKPEVQKRLNVVNN